MSNAAQAGLSYLGRSTDCFRLQPLENPALRVQLGLPARPRPGEDGGVLVSKLPTAASECKQVAYYRQPGEAHAHERTSRRWEMGGTDAAQKGRGCFGNSELS